jgi:hypothetical protein
VDLRVSVTPQNENGLFGGSFGYFRRPNRSSNGSGSGWRHRVSNPERFPRRIIRLLNEVRRIEFDVCASEASARDLEEQLICTLLPKFNRAGEVWPR